MERFGVSYQHILQIDQHRPGQTPPSCQFWSRLNRAT